MTRTALAAAFLVLVTAGCGSTAPDRSAAGSGEDLFAERAASVAQAWTESGLLNRWARSFVPAQPLTREPDWSLRGSLKAAFYGGWVRTATPLLDVPGEGEIRYAVDGTTVPVRTLGARTAYEDMVNPRAGDCPAAEGGSSDCDWVTVTRAKATTITVETGRGAATVPAWAFTVEGLAEPLVRVSVENAAEVGDFEPHLDPARADGRRLLLTGQDISGQAGTTLTVAVGSGDCDTEVRPHLLETERVIVVGGTALGPKPDQVCNAMLRIHELALDLARPVGSRPVLDAASGRPLLPRVPPQP